jgi:hypothetical protein
MLLIVLSPAGKGLIGAQASKIASETNRKFIFSSSFTSEVSYVNSGDKEAIKN